MEDDAKKKTVRLCNFNRKTTYCKRICKFNAQWIKYKILFGNKASDDLKASFSVIKVIGSSLTDNDVKSKVVDAVAEFFNITYWDFGETFYFTELAAYVHQQLDGHISSFVIVPDGASSVFGTLFQITPQSDELFVPDVSISDIELVKNITKENIKSIG